MNSIRLKVTGMSCGGCVRHVTAALQALEGVERVEVDLAGGLVRIDGSADDANLVAALAEAGYPAETLDHRSASAARTGGCSGGCCCS